MSVEVVPGGQRRIDLDEYGLLEEADGQAALEVVRVERPDLVILDLTMPRLDGLGACAALRSEARSWPGPGCWC